MIARFFHNWERRLAAADTDRVVRPFEWGLDWLRPGDPLEGAPPERLLSDWSAQALAESDRFFDAPATTDYAVIDGDGSAQGDSRTVMFPSAIETPHAENNRVYLRYFPGRPRGRSSRDRRAVVVLPQWNADANGHVGLCRLLAYFGISAARLSLPYHDRRRPASLTRAEFIVSPNVGQTLHVCRQAVIDARRAVQWLAGQGYERIGILGTSLGSCLSMLASAHEPLIRAQAFNHVSLYFADVVWEGLSTAHVRAGLDGHITLDTLRRLWMPISPRAYIDRVRGKSTLIVYARYDLSFPVPLSRAFVSEFRQRGMDFDLGVLPCGHYTTGVTPFKYLDGYYLTSFFRRAL
jgi:dienelactone hydrolase